MPPRKRGSGLSHQHKSGTGRSKRTANCKIGESKNGGITKSTSKRKRKSFLEVGTAAIAMATSAIRSSVATVSNASGSRLSKSNESYSSVTSLTNSSLLLTITPILDSKYKQKCTQETADIEINPDAFSETNGRKKRKSNEASKCMQWREVLKAVNLHLKNVLPLVQNDNYSEPKLVCRQLFSNVYEDIKSVYTFFIFYPSKYQNNCLCTLFLFKSHLKTVSVTFLIVYTLNATTMPVPL